MGSSSTSFLLMNLKMICRWGKNNPTFLTGVSQLGKSLHLKWQMFRKLFQVFGASTNLGVQNKKTTGFVGMLLGLKSTHGLKRLLELL